MEGKPDCTRAVDHVTRALPSADSTCSANPMQAQTDDRIPIKQNQPPTPYIEVARSKDAAHLLLSPNLIGNRKTHLDPRVSFIFFFPFPPRSPSSSPPFPPPLPLALPLPPPLGLADPPRPSSSPISESSPESPSSSSSSSICCWLLVWLL